MAKQVNKEYAREHLGELLEGVCSRGDVVTIESSGKPMGDIVPVEQYRKLERMRAEAADIIEAQWRKRPPVPYSETDEAEILAEVYAVRYGVE